MADLNTNNAADRLYMQGQLGLGDGSTDTPHPSYRSMVTGSVPPSYNGVGIDKTGFGGNIDIRAALTPATAWASKGYFSTAAAVGAAGYIDRDVMACDFNTQSQLVAFTLNMPTPVVAGSLPIMGNANATASGLQGVYLSVSGTTGVAGQFRPIFQTSAGVITTAAFTPSVVADGTEHHIVIAIDGPTKAFFVYVDGELETAAYGAFTGAAVPTANWNIGALGGDLSSLTAAALKLANFHALLFGGHLPSNLGGLVRRLYRRPRDILAPAEIRKTNKSVLLAIVGQSNEQGAGGYPAATGDYGAPRKDLTVTSMWPLLQSLAGERGTWLEIYNGALGSTSLAHSWVGIVRAWASNMLVTRGTYLLTGGNIYKCTGAASTVFTSTVAPTGTSPTQTGADGIQWTYKAAARAQDVAGYVYPHTDAYFDPNGMLAADLAGLNRSGFDAKWAAVSIGQGDKTMGTVRAEYAQALINMANYFLANSIKVALGFTVYGATAGLEAWYQSDLLPGLADAIASFSGNPNVVTGPNLRTALGVLPVTPNYGPGLDSTQLHMNNSAYVLASKEWDRVLALNGII